MENFAPEIDTFSDFTLNISLSRLLDKGPDWQETKTKAGYTFWNVYRGIVYIDINGRTYEAWPGDSVLFYPGNTCTAWTGPEGCSFHCMRFSIERAGRFDILAGENLAGIYRSPELSRRCVEFCQEYRARLSGDGGATLGFYALCVDLLARLLDPPGCETRFFEEEQQAKDNLLINRVGEQMRRHFTENIQIKDMAKEAGMSEKYFIRYFRRYFNISPKQYIIELRMRRAAELLSDTSDSVAAIAEKLGYSDQYSFSKAFRKFHGMSPTQYRRTPTGSPGEGRQGP